MYTGTWLYVWNAKAEKIQDLKKSHQHDYFKPRNSFSNPENNISYPWLNYITARTFLPCARRLIYMCKNEKIHARIKNLHRKKIATQNTKITPKFSYSHQDMKWHQIRQDHTKTKKATKTKNITPRSSWLHQDIKQHQIKQNHTETKISVKTRKNHTKIKLIAPRYKLTPRQTNSHQDEKFNQDGKKSYQDSRDYHKVMTSSVTWPYIRIVSLKVINLSQENHTNTQKLDQDIKFTPRRTWPSRSSDVIFPSGWPCWNMLWSAHKPDWQTSMVCG